MIVENKEAFAYGDRMLGDIVNHEIEVKMNIPPPYPPILRRAPYPASQRSRQELEKHIEELVEMKVLRKCEKNEEVNVTTPVIIAWHNGKSRMVGDFRALNTYTEPVRYPMPRIEQSLTNLANAKYITSMDVLKGFHQIKVSPESRKFLRIICHKGVYEYLRMPFGIKNAPSYFQSMMDSEFRVELTENWLLIYIDDIIIFSETWEDHVEQLRRILKRVAEMGLTISLKKCHFGYQ